MTATTILYGAGILAAFAYLPRAAAPATAARSVLKALPLCAFALAAWLAGASAFLTAALGLSALGDFALSRTGRAAFLYGLGSFGLAHLLYVLAFTDAAGLPLWEAWLRHPVSSIGLILLAISTELWLSPHAGRLAWPVRGYVVLIAAMGLAALTMPAPLAAATAGAALFVASDLILAIRLFRLPEGHAAEASAARATWVLYVAGQALIVLAFAAP